jgi:hypothetical protein
MLNAIVIPVDPAQPKPVQGRNAVEPIDLRSGCLIEQPGRAPGLSP